MFVEFKVMPTAVPQTLESLTYEQLVDLAAKVETQRNLKHREAEKAQREMRSILDTMLSTLKGTAIIPATAKSAKPAQIMPATKPTNGTHKVKAKTKPKTKGSPMKGTKAPVKYRNGTDTWSGRGKAPTWLANLEKAGRSRTEFAVTA